MLLPSQIAIRRLIPGLTALVLLAFTLAVPAAAEDPMYVASLADLRGLPAGEVLATLNPATPMTVKTRQGGNLQVEIQGWSRAGAEKYMFKQPGIRIIMAILGEEAIRTRTVGKTVTDDYGVEWTEATITGWIADKDAAADRDSVWTAASDIYFSHCNRCHTLRPPKRLMANQWPQILKIMTVRAGLTPEQTALVTMLLQYHARDQDLEDSFTAQASKLATAAPPDFPKIAGSPELALTGGALFLSKNCAACHGADARTPVLPHYPRLAGQSPEYIYKQIQDFRAGSRGNDKTGAMAEKAKQLSDAEAQAIAWWLSQQ